MSGITTEPETMNKVLGASPSQLGHGAAALAGRLSGRRQSLSSARQQETDDAATSRGLGWFSVGLGLTQLLAPRALGTLIGVGTSDRTARTMRACGVRELTAGIGILARPDSAGWLWSRVAGDLIDIGLLAGVLGSRRSSPVRVSLAMGAVAGMTVLDVMASRRMTPAGNQGRRARANEPVRVTSSITVGHSPEETYGVWRNFQNLPRFMIHLQSVEVRDSHQSHWRAMGPGGKTIEWDATITDDRPHELIAWTTSGVGAASGLESSGEVRFLRAPGGRGTEIRLSMRGKPPGGPAVGLIAKALRKLPEQQVDNDLRRFKQLLEVGEVTQSDASIHAGPHPARPSNAAAPESSATTADATTFDEGRLSAPTNTL